MNQEPDEPLVARSFRFEALGRKIPCTVLNGDKDAYLKEWREKPQILQPLNHPLIIFYLQAAKAFAENLKDSLAGNEKLKGKSGEEFWRAWEFEYLGKKLIDKERLKLSFAEIYDRMASRWGQSAVAAMLEPIEVGK